MKFVKKINNFTILSISLIVSLLMCLAVIFDKEIKEKYNLCWSCIEKINFTESLFLLFFSFLFFSFLFLFKKNKDAFEKWKTFSFYYLIINSFLIMITPIYWGDEFLNIQRSEVSLFLFTIHFFISWFFVLKKFGK